MVFFFFLITFVCTSKRVFTVFCNHVKWCVFSYPVLCSGIKLPYHICDVYLPRWRAAHAILYTFAYCAVELNKLRNKNSIHSIRACSYRIVSCVYYIIWSIRMSRRSCGGGGGRLRRVPVDPPRVICLIVLRFFNHCPRHSDGKLFLRSRHTVAVPSPSSRTT